MVCAGFFVQIPSAPAHHKPHSFGAGISPCPCRSQRRGLENAFHACGAPYTLQRVCCHEGCRGSLGSAPAAWGSNTAGHQASPTRCHGRCSTGAAGTTHTNIPPAGRLLAENALTGPIARMSGLCPPFDASACSIGAIPRTLSVSSTLRIKRILAQHEADCMIFFVGSLCRLN